MFRPYRSGFFVLFFLFVFSFSSSSGVRFHSHLLRRVLLLTELHLNSFRNPVLSLLLTGPQLRIFWDLHCTSGELSPNSGWTVERDIDELHAYLKYLYSGACERNWRKRKIQFIQTLLCCLFDGTIYQESSMSRTFSELLVRLRLAWALWCHKRYSWRASQELSWWMD